ncbi:MAG TPA: AMP-dependent synthetase/ligase [Acidimicrobiales bacterium]|nr:AMP-dependent synthetase/ligase [Acidimicrobiales bacterium]
MAETSIDDAVAGLTIPTFFGRTVARCGDQPALRWKGADGTWQEWTWNDYAERVARAATAFRDLGLRRGDRAVLMLRNIPEFHVADAAFCHLGVCSISIYNSSSPDQVQYLAAHSEAKIAIVEDMGFLDRFLTMRDELPAIATYVIVRDGDGDRAAPADVKRWDELLTAEPADLEKISQDVRPDDLATVIYTSGTTGPPKGVVLDHHNIVWTGESLLRAIDDDIAGWRQVSYLPMAHIAERMTGHYNPMRTGSIVACCPDTGLIAEYLRDVHPNLLFGVPRIFEKIHAGVMAVVANEPDAERRAAMENALAVGRKVAEAKANGENIDDDLRAQHEQAEQAVLGLARMLTGLDEMKVAISGAAPISEEVLWFFRAIGVNLSEIYGMSESTGPITWDPYDVRIGTVGRALPGVEVTLADDGEVCFRGGNAFRGYLKDDEKTADAIDADGWVHTGDIGEIDGDGYLRIVDRKKELIITAGGKNISPANIESILKSYPLIGQVAVIGDRRKFLSALVVLDPDVAPAWAAQHGVTVTSFAALADDPVVRAEIERNVDDANRHFSKTEGIKKFTILREEWVPDSEEMTPTMKLKRRGIHEKYAAEIEAMYA